MPRSFTRRSFALLAAAGLLALAAPSLCADEPARCAAPVAGKLSVAEMKQRAKLTLAQARAAAVKAVGEARLKRVSSGELEVEHGCLVYSFDLRLKDRAGVEEVMIDAVSGAVLSRSHETPAQEKAEKAEKAADREAPPAH